MSDNYKLAHFADRGQGRIVWQLALTFLTHAKAQYLQLVDGRFANHRPQEEPATRWATDQ